MQEPAIIIVIPAKSSLVKNRSVCSSTQQKVWQTAEKAHTIMPERIAIIKGTLKINFSIIAYIVEQLQMRSVLRLLRIYFLCYFH